jgi:hypothetical protein
VIVGLSQPRSGVNLHRSSWRRGRWLEVPESLTWPVRCSSSRTSWRSRSLVVRPAYRRRVGVVAGNDEGGEGGEGVASAAAAAADDDGENPDVAEPNSSGRPYTDRSGNPVGTVD